LYSVQFIIFRSKLEETENILVKVRRDNVIFIQNIGDVEAQLDNQVRFKWKFWFYTLVLEINMEIYFYLLKVTF
jgi:hypothetical protein